MALFNSIDNEILNQNTKQNVLCCVVTNKRQTSILLFLKVECIPNINFFLCKSRRLLVALHKNEYRN